ncbi:putative lipid II flippase FtsW [Candidatus Microgenomates bacterium]|nr:putative lipid II flippase FtsW [Candidatus Microgenomates bacterium]
MKKRAPVKLVRQKRRFNFILAGLALALSLFGLLMIYESSNIAAFQSFQDKYHFLRDQGLWLVIGSIGMIVVSFVNYKKYSVLAIPLLIGALLCMIAVFIPGVGIKTLGAHRWVNFHFFQFQPSELTKLALIIYLSSWFSTFEKKRLLAFFILLTMVVGLVMLQPDLGTASILTVIFIVMYFVSGAPFWHFAFLVPVISVGAFILMIISPYRFQRLTTYLNPNFDPLGASYHIRQILISFSSGGFWGLGLGASRQKYQFLPEATTDSIFAIIAEEFGFFGSLLFILFYLFFLYQLFKITLKAPDKQGFLLGSGIFTLIAFQTIVNLGSMVAIFPLTGVPLPLISYGGSNMVITFIAIGLMLNIKRQSS